MIKTAPIDFKMNSKMKYLIKYLFVSFSLLLINSIIVSAATTDTNLVANPGFETVPLQNWTLVAKNGNTPTLDSTVSHSGHVSVKTQASNIVGSSGYPLSASIRVLPNQTYTFSIWGKVTGITNEAVARVDEYDIYNRFLREQYIPFSTGTADWMQKQREFKTLTNTHHIYIYTNIYNGYGTLWIDDISLSLKNAGFFQINQDKTISINGKKTFPVFMQDICNEHADSLYPTYSSFPCNVANFTNFTGEYYGSSFQGWILGYNSTDWNAMRAEYEKNGMLWSMNINTISYNFPTSSYFMGFSQQDEAAPGNGFPSNWTEQQVIDRMVQIYNTIKSKDTNPNHYVFLNHYKNLRRYLPATDIISWDTYTIKYNNVPTGYVTWQRSDSMYVYEIQSYNNVLGGTVETIDKPVLAVIQANGIPLAIDSTSLYVPTPKEVRANTYLAITLNVSGIAYYGYKTGQGEGLVNNGALLSYYKQIARELKSLNDILALPTIDYSSWKHPGTKITLSNNPPKSLFGYTINPLNYILKRNGNVWYLIVINKDSSPKTNVIITINGLSGSMTAKTLGLETTGSQRAGRTISVNNGQFIDSFDGYAAHIYQIA